MTRGRLLLSVIAIGVAAAVFYPRACSDVEVEAIVVEGGRVTVTNKTGTDWSDVEVWLNDHYRGQLRSLVAGQRLDIPIRTFVAGYGQNFDPRKQAPYGVEVTAKASDGTPVRLTWGQGRRR